MSTVQNSPSLDHYTPCPKYVTDGVMLVEKFRENMLGNVRDKSVKKGPKIIPHSIIEIIKKSIDPSFYI